jgi:hypothetical protein
MGTCGQIHSPAAVTTEKISPFIFRIGGVVNPRTGKETYGKK